MPPLPIEERCAHLLLRAHAQLPRNAGLPLCPYGLCCVCPDPGSAPRSRPSPRPETAPVSARPPDPRMPKSCPRALRARSIGDGRTDSHDRTPPPNIASRLTSRCRRCRSENVARTVAPRSRARLRLDPARCFALQSLIRFRPPVHPSRPFVSRPASARRPSRPTNAPRSCPRALRARSSGGGRTDSHDRTSGLNIASRLTSPCRRCRSQNLARTVAPRAHAPLLLDFGSVLWLSGPSCVFPVPGSSSASRSSPRPQADLVSARRPPDPGMPQFLPARPCGARSFGQA